MPENERLLNLFGDAVSELLMFQEQHFIALVGGEPDAERYELLIHMAGEKRQAAKYALCRPSKSMVAKGVPRNALVELGAMRARRNAERPERRKQSDRVGTSDADSWIWTPSQFVISQERRVQCPSACHSVSARSAEASMYWA